jgi:hypothetical protein
LCTTAGDVLAELEAAFNKRDRAAAAAKEREGLLAALVRNKHNSSACA